MEELLAYLARNLVDHPDQVRVERVEQDGAVVLRLHVGEGDRVAGGAPLVELEE